MRLSPEPPTPDPRPLTPDPTAGIIARRRRAFEEALSWLDFAAEASEGAEQAAAVSSRVADILGRAGWTDPPRHLRRPGTPARGLAQMDLDLG
jgi:hypothetical protein